MTKKKLSDVQIEALDSINDSFINNVNPICAAGTGSGKTRVACEVIQSIINANNSNYRILIIHKASNHDDPWLQELIYYKLIKKPRSKPRGEVLNPKGLTPLINEIDQSADTQSRYIYIHGKDRNKHLNKEKYHFPKKVILFTSYETLRLDIEHNYYDLTKKFDLIIFDELHTIINYKRLTKKSINIYRIQAKKKLALTASPMNNHENELGIQYAFLNDSTGFSELINLYSFKMNEKEKKNTELETKIIAYNELCVKNRFIFYCYEKKSGFQKNAVIFSLPIDEQMLSMVNEMPPSHIAKQRRFLSHPSALFKDKDISTLPYCTKEHAVRIILQSMLYNEKAVIFSLYIDVLNVYADICRNIGLPAMIITGNDKGKKLNHKLIEFKNSATIKILLTTLQKSAEGFNFYYATHVIILEFWWNPQKILQAMSRIDRKKQRRNIFIYILCYNNEGTMIKQEKCFYDIMVKKLKKANSIFQKIEQIHPKKNPDLQTIYPDISEIKSFINADTFENELELYIGQFQHTPKNEEINYDSTGLPFSVTRDKMINEINNKLIIFNILENAPWRIETKEVKLLLDKYYKLSISTYQNILFNQAIEGYYINYKIKPNLNTYYHTIFVKHVNFRIRMFSGSIEILPLTFLIGKMDNGKYDLLGIYRFSIRKEIFKSFFNNLIERGVRKNEIILATKYNIRGSRITHNLIPEAVAQTCFSSLFESIINEKIMNSEELEYIDHIFSANTYNEAMSICEMAVKDEKSTHKIIFKGLNNLLLFNKKLFSYKPKDRNIIGTLNIVTYIIDYLGILLDERKFINVEEAILYINYYSDKILQNGKHFIPNWDILSAPINE